MVVLIMLTFGNIDNIDRKMVSGSLRFFQTEPLTLQ